MEPIARDRDPASATDALLGDNNLSVPLKARSSLSGFRKGEIAVGVLAVIGVAATIFLALAISKGLPNIDILQKGSVAFGILGGTAGATAMAAIGVLGLEIAHRKTSSKVTHSLKIPFEQAPTTKSLVESYNKCWNDSRKEFENIPFDADELRKHILANNEMFAPIHNPSTDFGFIEKRDLKPGSKIFVRADLHGDLKSLLENIKTFQQQGYLDENYKCRPNVQIVFLGDYSDRGAHSLEVLQLITTLRMENPEQVGLIRGNHESLIINGMFAAPNDKNFRNFLLDETSSDLLNKLYNTLPLTIYMSELTDSGERQYVQFTHGLFELHIDPATLLENPSTHAKMVVPKMKELSERVSKIDQDLKEDYEAQLAQTPKGNPERKKIKQKLAAQKIVPLFNKDKERYVQGDDSIYSPNHLSVYNWGDMGESNPWMGSWMGSLGDRRWKLTVEDVKHSLRLSSARHKIKMVFRGHEHLKQHHVHQGKILVSTMPVGMDSPYSSRYPDQLDTAYILTTGPKVKDWTKVAYLRDQGKSTKQITDPVSIRDQSI